MSSPPRYTAAEMLARLVAFDTTSRRSNLDLVDFVSGYLAGFGITARLFRDPQVPKANLFATIGPDVAGGVILSGHTDVVPVDGQDWSSDPFALIKREGRWYGRGTADMKGFLAVVLAMVPDIVQAGLARPVHLALSYDEELGCAGVHSMIAGLAEMQPRPALCIVGEPTEMAVVTRHKGLHAYETVVIGREGHSSAPEAGASAIAAAGELIAFLNRLGEEMRERAEPLSPFETPYSTINVGLIEGGTAVNILARECRFLWECRPMPGWDAQEILRRFTAFAEADVLARMRKTAPDARIETRELAGVPAFTAGDNSPAEELARALTGQNETGAVAFTTEAGLFQDIGIACVVCGPGSVRQAHQPDEFIEISQLDECARFIARLIEALKT